MKTKLKKWKKISSKLIYKNKYVELFQDLVQLPNGRKYKYTVSNKHGRAVIVMAIDKQARILLTKEFRYPINKVSYSVVGGTVEKKETPRSAAKRELKEETGFSAGKFKLLDTFYASPSRSGTIFYAYVATDLKPGKAQPEFMEFIETEFLSQKKIDGIIRSGEVKDPYTLATYLLYKLKK